MDLLINKKEGAVNIFTTKRLQKMFSKKIIAIVSHLFLMQVVLEEEELIVHTIIMLQEEPVPRLC